MEEANSISHRQSNDRENDVPPTKHKHSDGESEQWPAKRLKSNMVSEHPSKTAIERQPVLRSARSIHDLPNELIQAIVAQISTKTDLCSLSLAS